MSDLKALVFCIRNLFDAKVVQAKSYNIQAFSNEKNQQSVSSKA